MAAGQIPAIGTELGPCEGICNHRDCATNRRYAGAACGICGHEIGYETSFYQMDRSDSVKWYGSELSPHGTVLYNTADKAIQLVHAVCLEDRIEAERKG